MKMCKALGAVALIGLVGCGSGVGTQSSSSGSPAVDYSKVGLTATGASLVCPSSGQNAWATYGGTNGGGFVTVVNNIIANVGSELTAHGTTNLGTSFGTAGSGTLPSNQDNGATFAGKLTAFLAFTYGGPLFLNYKVGTSNATGNPDILITFPGPQGMRAAHVGFNITAAQYTYFVTNAVVPALTSAGIPNGDISTCFAPPLLDQTFIASMVGQ